MEVMKIIKVCVHKEISKQLIKKLEENGAINIMIENIEEIADWNDKDAQIYSLEYLEKYNRMVKIEFLCNENKVDELCNIIKNNSKTGHYDEGAIIIQQTEKFIPLAKK